MSGANINFNPVAIDEIYNTILAPANTKGTQIGRLSTRIGVQPYIVALRNAWDAAGNGLLTFRLQINDSFAPPPYDGSVNQWGPPEQEVYLTRPIQIPQGSSFRIVVDNADPVNAFNVTARAIVVYRSISDALLEAGYK